ncbi:MAG: sterol desaturase/sphingolipid hydroxylase (fatty acid hydroxylase superfamily) [Pseudomonadales bacterium]
MEEINYKDSFTRTVISWLLYPPGVLLPLACIVAISTPDNPQRLLPLALIGLITSCLAEFIQPHMKKRQSSHNDIITDIAHATLSLGLATLLRVILIYVFFLAVSSTSESFALVTWPSNWPLGLQVILGLAVAELGTYWRHRLFHEWNIAWRFHSVHHSSKRLYFLNATRFHFIDLCLAGLASAIPLALCGASAEIVVLVSIFTGLHGNWQHANARYRLGWLNWVYSAAELHRWHHSSIISQSNSNYGNNLIIWDTIFGTRYLPTEPQNVEQFGLGTHGEVYPQTWRKQLLVPFLWERLFKQLPDQQAAQNEQQHE